ncbi:hypothetical protein ABIA33_000543 [Streptacidiphilus sp. MAP12-16]
MLLLLAGVSSCSNTPQASTSAGTRPDISASAGNAAVPATHARPFDRSGDPQCAITYYSVGANMTTWTATTTIAGELVTQATHTGGQPDRNDVTIPAGHHTFIAWAALAKITDLNGTLHAGGTQYHCSVAPAR